MGVLKYMGDLPVVKQADLTEIIFQGPMEHVSESINNLNISQLKKLIYSNLRYTSSIRLHKTVAKPDSVKLKLTLLSRAKLNMRLPLTANLINIGCDQQQTK